MDHLGRGSPRPGDLLLGDTPHVRDLLAVLQHVDVAIAGQLRCLLPHLATALAVTLASHHHRPAAEFAELPTRQRQIDRRQTVIDAVRAVLDATRVHD